MNQENNSNIILSYVLKKPGKKYSIALIASIFLIIIGVISVYHTLNYGFAFWGINNSVAWGITIANFIFWIGIAHSGTLISAILFLFRQDWRKSMHRAAEVMTLISVACAAFFPLIHTGRPWFSMYWLFPYPNTMDAWQNFQSPLIWDFLAILIYFIVSFIFLYLGLLPDLSAVSGKKNGITSKIYYLFSLGWRGTRTEWKNYNKTYKLVAGLLVPLVISVHSIVSFDFAVTILPGWHSTMFPPYFVIGAIFSGCSLVEIMLLLTRKAMKLNNIIEISHLEKLSKIILLCSLLILFFYLTEVFFVFYNGNPFEITIYKYRTSNGFIASTIIILFCNIIVPQLLWWNRLRTNPIILFAVSVCVLAGMWLERVVIVLSSMERSYLPMNWYGYFPSVFEISLLLGSFGFFLFCYLIIIRIVPSVSIYDNSN